MGRGRQDQAHRRRLTRPWAAHRSTRPRQAERPPATGNPPPFLRLRAPPGSTGRLLQLAEPPHPRRVTPPRGKQQRIRDDRAVRSPDSSREILRAIGADQRLRTSAPSRTVRLPRHIPDLPPGELPLKLAPALTVPHGLSSIHAQQHAHPPAMSTRRQTRCDSFRSCQSTTSRQPQLTGDVLAGAYKNSSGSSTRRARASDLILRHRRAGAHRGPLRSSGGGHDIHQKSARAYIGLRRSGADCRAADPQGSCG